jgi:hypothetical protein
LAEIAALSIYIPADKNMGDKGARGRGKEERKRGKEEKKRKKEEDSALKIP